MHTIDIHAMSDPHIHFTASFASHLLTVYQVNNQDSNDRFHDFPAKQWLRLNDRILLRIGHPSNSLRYLSLNDRKGPDTHRSLVTCLLQLCSRNSHSADTESAIEVSLQCDPGAKSPDCNTILFRISHRIKDYR